MLQLSLVYALLLVFQANFVKNFAPESMQWNF